jgi:hypothetical protein
MCVVSVTAQATSTEVWLYRNREAREAVIAFRGTSNPQDMATDASLSLSAFSPGDRRVGPIYFACRQPFAVHAAMHDTTGITDAPLCLSAFSPGNRRVWPYPSAMHASACRTRSLTHRLHATACRTRSPVHCMHATSDFLPYMLYMHDKRAVQRLHDPYI